MSVVVKDQEFYTFAQDGVDIVVKLNEGRILVGDREFIFEFSEIERRLMVVGGIAQAFNEHGKSVFEALSAPMATKMFSSGTSKKSAPIGDEKEKAGLQW